MAVDWSTAAARKASQDYLDRKLGRQPQTDEQQAEAAARLQANRDYQASRILRSGLRRRNHV